MNGQTDEISRKEIFSMTEEELYAAHEEVNELIAELKTVIKEHEGQLSKLAPQLQAEQEQSATYMYQHIKPLPDGSVLPPGLRLKVYENGKDFGGTLVYISSRDWQKCCAAGSKEGLLELLPIIEQKLNRSAVLRLKPTRLFDEKGHEINDPQSLQEEQKIWVSYGEDYRPSFDSILNLSFDKVVCTEEDGNKVIYKAFLDPDTSLAGYNSWTFWPRFPDNVTPTYAQLPHKPEVMDEGSLFLQSKADEQMVLHPSVMVEKRTRAPGQSGNNGHLDQSVSSMLSCHVWLFSKDGMISSKAMPRVCLAVGPPLMLSNGEGSLFQGYRLTLKKRDRNDSAQFWGFRNKGSVFSKAYPEFVLTHLEELHLREVVTPAGDNATHHELWISSDGDPDAGSSAEQLSRPLAAQSLPAGGPGERRQLTVALVRNLEEKHPKASAQRWAIKHEGLAKPGQWKLSKVENPLWNKLTYLWPVLPNGQINEDFDWPLQGTLIVNSPPLEKPFYDHPSTHTPARLKVLRNGDSDKSRACVIVGPNLSVMLRKHVSSSDKKLFQSLPKKDIKEDTVKKIDQTELQQFLERCTQIMNLPSAACRVFNEAGAEILRLRDVERDQLVYVSCGEQWIDPQVSAMEHKSHLLLSNLTSDVTLIQNYFSLRDPDNLVLEVNGDIVAGARLSVNYCAVQTANEEQDTLAEEDKAEETEIIVQESDLDEFVSSHIRAHRLIDARFTGVKYAWQQVPPDTVDDSSAVTDENQPPKPTNTYGYPRKLKQTHHQQFKYVDGQIINLALPDLVLGVTGMRAGAEVFLVERNSDDLSQHWKYMEENRTFHLASNTDFVLAVSMPKVYPGLKENKLKLPGCPVTLQKYEEQVNGAANQKWCNNDPRNVISAFYTDQLDKEVTAANHTSVCTFTVTGAEKISQPGYILMSSNQVQNIMTCVSCTRIVRPDREVRKVPAGILFSCATGQKDSDLSPLGPFQCLLVRKTDLSVSEAQNTLNYLKEVLSAMRSQHLVYPTTPERAVERTQRALRIKAYKNGHGFKNGRLIIAGSFTELLDMCTIELDLPRPACRLYTADGTVIVTFSDLIDWAMNDFFKQNEEQTRTEEKDIDDPKDVMMVMNETSRTMTMNPEDMKADEYWLSYILRHPVEVWVSCGEPFLSLQSIERSEKQEKMHWMQKKKILSGRYIMKHKVRHLQGRRVKSLAPPTMVPTTSPAQPVIVEGGWTELTNEEMKLQEDIEHAEMHLSDMQISRLKIDPTVANSEKPLYNFPTMKRVLAYINGGNSGQAVLAWGKSLEELLDDCTLKLRMSNQPAKVLYNVDGGQVTSWNDITRDMLLCVSAGEPFMTPKDSRDKIKVRANYARIRKKYGPDATDVIMSTPRILY